MSDRSPTLSLRQENKEKCIRVSDPDNNYELATLGDLKKEFRQVQLYLPMGFKNTREMILAARQKKNISR